MLNKTSAYGFRRDKYKAYCLLDDSYVILSTLKAFYYFYSSGMKAKSKKYRDIFKVKGRGTTRQGMENWSQKLD